MNQYLIQENALPDFPSNQQTLITLKQIAQTSHEQILHIIHQKDTIIRNFSQQITRLKAEDIKSKKLISSLQQKIQKTLASGTNTSSTFMIASQFKNLLTTFMTNTIPGVFYDFVDDPEFYAHLVKKIMQEAYNKISKILEEKLQQIVQLLTEKKDNPQNFRDMQKKQEQLRFCLLNYFQNNFKELFLFKSNQNKSQPNSRLISIKLLTTGVDDEITKKISILNSQQLQNSEEMNQFCQQLYQICIYMILQESPWQFIFDQKGQNYYNNLQENNQKVIFSKKQFTCIDGFVKQGKQVCYVLKGLRKKQNSEKEYHYHPNIKNFVLPVNYNDLSMTSLDLEVRINFIKTYSAGQDGNNNPIIVKQNPSRLFETQSIQTNENPLTDRIKQIQQSILKNHSILRIQKLSETQQSQQVMEFYQAEVELKVKQDSEQNCIVNPTDNYFGSHKTNSADKENINVNCGNHYQKSKAHQTESHTKKQKVFNNEKILSKKSKKQKNISTIDLTGPKKKLNQKECHLQREVFNDLYNNNINPVKNYELPLGNGSSTHVKGSHKKKASNNNNNKTSRKCSVGKIISQSIHMVGGSRQTANREKVSLSQHCTMLMKESCSMKPVVMKDNNFFVGNDAQQRDKENVSQFASHMYERQLVRPKRSVKLGVKNIDQKLFSIHYNNPTNSQHHNVSKQERPLILKQHKLSNCLNMGKLRQKYLAN